jgi:hypothetical protein
MQELCENEIAGFAPTQQAGRDRGNAADSARNPLKYRRVLQRYAAWERCTDRHPAVIFGGIPAA